MEVCPLCENPFPRRKKCRGFEKTRMQAAMRRYPITVHAALVTLYSYEGPCEGHVCWECYAKANKHYHAYTTTPSQADEDPSPEKRTAPVEIPHVKKKQKTGVEDDEWLPVFDNSPPKKLNRGNMKHPRRIRAARLISRAVKNSNYYTALRHMMSCGEAAEKALLRYLSYKARREVKQYAKDNSYPKLNGTSSVETFSWTSMIDDMREKMPNLLTTVEAAMPCVDEKSRSLLLPRMGFMLSILLYTIDPKKFSFLQALNGVQMWQCGSGNKLLRCFNRLGICQGIHAIKKRAGMFCEEPDNKMEQWKEALGQQGNETVDGLDAPPTEEISDNEMGTTNPAIIPSVSEPMVDDSDEIESPWEDVSDESDEDT